MAILNAQETFIKIKSLIDQYGSAYSNWYTGITSDPETRLFQQHGVSKDTDVWTFQRCQSEQGARDVEAALLELGCDGGPGGGEKSCDYNYAYRKSRNTNP